jgi:hypothetical protein
VPPRVTETGSLEVGIGGARSPEGLSHDRADKPMTCAASEGARLLSSVEVECTEDQQWTLSTEERVWDSQRT